MSLAKLALKSSLILVITKFSEKTLGLISTLILARILVPEDFGIVAISLLVIYFMATVSNSGGKEYIVRKDDVDQDDIDTFWTLNICLKVAIYLLVLLLTPLIVNFYDDNRLQSLLPVLALSLPIAALVNPATVICQRELNYIPILKIDVIRKLVSITIAISIAIYFESYWALIWSHLASNITHVLCSYIFLKYSPSLTLINIKKQWGFSQWMLYRSVLGYCRSQLDTILVSAFYSPSSLGGFHISKYISNMPATDFFGPALEPLLASFARNKDNVDNFKHQITLTVLVIAVTVIPSTAFIYFNASTIVDLVLGDKWSEYSSLFGVLSLLIIPHSLAYLGSTVMTSMGRVNVLFYYDLLTLLLMGVVLYLLKERTLEYFTYGKFLVEIFMVTILLLIGNIRIFKKNTISIFFYLIIPSFLSFTLAYLLGHLVLEVPSFIKLSILFFVFLFCWVLVCILMFVLFLRQNHSANHLKHIIMGILRKCVSLVWNISPKHKFK
ncbi:oligosaccharide flippase family protein [Alteromonas sp. W364]|uniref:oligosaccharide flippase family protein n=1 Tax=Alteromonas sp. W364 TaxID=3075610 RepID=UPI0028842839|nr:oligosaccharide flippase family protein [Alteromonas sp. W364]MDT0627685.1 oligosaccharide flippase family protein [Alteromonas sp. W364]